MDANPFYSRPVSILDIKIDYFEKRISDLIYQKLIINLPGNELQANRFESLERLKCLEPFEMLEMFETFKTVCLKWPVAERKESKMKNRMPRMHTG